MVVHSSQNWNREYNARTGRYFTMDPISMQGEYDNGSSKGAGRTEYIWLPTEDGNATPIGIYRGGQFYAIHSDHLGTPRLMTNEVNKPVWQWPYSAFGNNKPTGILKATAIPKAAITNRPVLLTATGAPEMVLRFPGQMDDTETGTVYNYFRLYDAKVGAYRQPDPIGLLGGWSLYPYANGNPLSYIDPEGLRSGAGARRPAPAPMSRDPLADRHGSINFYASSSPCLRVPDFVNFQIDAYVGSVSGTFTRDGNSFVGGGLNMGLLNPLSLGASVTAGWLNQSTVSPGDANNFAGGYSGGGAAAYAGFGGGFMYSPGFGTATVVGFGAGTSFGAKFKSGASFGAGYSADMGSTGLGWGASNSCTCSR